MVRSEHNRLFFVMIGVLFLWLLLWLFVTKLMWWSSVDTRFATQSADGSVGWDQISCPRADKIMMWNKPVYLTNPLVDKSEPMLALQQWFVAENFDQRWPTWSTHDDRKVQFPDDMMIDTVQAQLVQGIASCVYSQGDTPIFHLRQDMISDECITQWDYFLCQ